MQATVKHFPQENLSSAHKRLDLKQMTMGIKKGPPLPFKKDHEYDVIVIGGGTGGLSFAQEARKYKLSVALFDYVEPSPQ